MNVYIYSVVDSDNHPEFLFSTLQACVKHLQSTGYEPDEVIIYRAEIASQQTRYNFEAVSRVEYCTPTGGVTNTVTPLPLDLTFQVGPGQRLVWRV